MIAQRCKVLVVRFDARFPYGYQHNGNNAELSALISTLKEGLSYHSILSHYVWVREQVSSDLPHYHVLLLLDGAKVQNPRGILMSAEQQWQRILGVNVCGLIHFCNQGEMGVGHYMIRRPSGRAEGLALESQQQAFQASYSQALERASYLAKPSGKGIAPPRVRDFGCSVC